MRYELFYWPGIQGRGEFVRLALEAAGAEYVDVARQPESEGGGVPAMMKLMRDTKQPHPPFAPPFLRAGKLLIGQTANILAYLSPHLGLVPHDEAARLWAGQLQMTVTDFIAEIHDTHHPIDTGLYYDDQREAAAQRSAAFLAERAPKFLGYFERVLTANPAGHRHLVGGDSSYVDLSLFQVVEGLRFAFPRAMRRLETKLPRLAALNDSVAKWPGVAAYLASPRRIAFNNDGIFRHYPELDSAA